MKPHRKLAELTRAVRLSAARRRLSSVSQLLAIPLLFLLWFLFGLMGIGLTVLIYLTLTHWGLNETIARGGVVIFALASALLAVYPVALIYEALERAERKASVHHKRLSGRQRKLRQRVDDLPATRADQGLSFREAPGSEGGLTLPDAIDGTLSEVEE
jgi:type VI protein secretion system component VasK